MASVVLVLPVVTVRVRGFVDVGTGLRRVDEDPAFAGGVADGGLVVTVG